MAAQRFPRMKLWRAVDRVVEELDDWILGYAHQLEGFSDLDARGAAAVTRRMRALQNIVGELLIARDDIGNLGG